MDKSNYDRVRARDRKQAGLCKDCGDPIEQGKSRCKACLDRAKIQAKRHREELAEKSACLQCGSIELYSKTYCKRCYEANRISGKKSRGALKVEVMQHYGGHCACCGEDRISFLVLDHINDDGKSHREVLKSVGGSGFYAKIKRTGFPAGLQVLCANCNLSKEILGKCIHAIEREIAVETKH